MKDFHDLILMGRAPGLLDKEQLGAAIAETFEHRGTPLTTMNTYWPAHGSTMGTWWNDNNMPQHFKQAVLEINNFLGTIDLPYPGSIDGTSLI